MHSEDLLLDLHRLFWWAMRTCGAANMLRFIAAFQSCFEAPCSVAKAGISSCLISRLTNFNNYTVPHQHGEHVDPPTSFKAQHPGINICTLFSFFQDNFYLHNLISLIFPLFWKQGPKANGKSHFTRHYCEINLWYIFNYERFIILLNNIMKWPGAPLLCYWSW